jgi:hypothetical protein
VTAGPGFQARPEIYSRRAWLFMSALDPLPWPWGEEILAKLFAAKAFIRPSRLRKALAWAGHYPVAGRSRWRLALSCCPITAASWPGKRSWESGLRMTFAAT